MGQTTKIESNGIKQEESSLNHHESKEDNCPICMMEVHPIETKQMETATLLATSVIAVK